MDVFKKDKMKKTFDKLTIQEWYRCKDGFVPLTDLEGNICYGYLLGANYPTSLAFEGLLIDLDQRSNLISVKQFVNGYSLHNYISFDQLFEEIPSTRKVIKDLLRIDEDSKLDEFTTSILYLNGCIE